MSIMSSKQLNMNHLSICRLIVIQLHLENTTKSFPLAECGYMHINSNNRDFSLDQGQCPRNLTVRDPAISIWLE